MGTDADMFALPLALAAFAAGAVLLQWQPVLPPVDFWGVVSTGAAAIAVALHVVAGRTPVGKGTIAALAVVAAGAGVASTVAAEPPAVGPFGAPVHPADVPCVNSRPDEAGAKQPANDIYIDEHEVSIVAVLVVVGARHNDDDRFAIGRDLRIGDANDASHIFELHKAPLLRQSDRCKKARQD